MTRTPAESAEELDRADPDRGADPDRAAADRADGYAVASFVSGLTGLLVFNLLLGPLALVLAALAIRGGTPRRGRALAGALLGAADLIVLAVLVTADGTVSWSIAG